MLFRPRLSLQRSPALQDHVDGIVLGAFEVVAIQKSVVFHVSNDGFDGIAFELAPDAASHTALLSGIEYLDIGNVVAAITKIDITTLRTSPRQSIYLLQCSTECMAIVGTARQRLCTHHQVG